MRNSAGLAPLPLPQFAWSSVDKRRTNRTPAPTDAADPPTPTDEESRPDAVNDSTGEGSN